MEGGGNGFFEKNQVGELMGSGEELEVDLVLKVSEIIPGRGEEKYSILEECVIHIIVKILIKITKLIVLHPITNLHSIKNTLIRV